MNIAITNDDKIAEKINPSNGQSRKSWYGIPNVKRMIDFDSGISYLKFRGNEYDVKKTFNSLVKLWEFVYKEDEQNKKPFWKFVIDKKFRDDVYDAIESSWGFKLVES